MSKPSGIHHAIVTECPEISGCTLYTSDSENTVLERELSCNGLDKFTYVAPNQYTPSHYIFSTPLPAVHSHMYRADMLSRLLYSSHTPASTSVCPSPCTLVTCAPLNRAGVCSRRLSGPPWRRLCEIAGARRRPRQHCLRISFYLHSACAPFLKVSPPPPPLLTLPRPTLIKPALFPFLSQI